MANTNVVAFKGNLPALNINHFQKALANTKNSVGVTGGGKQYLKLLKNGGYWVYGQKDTEVEEGSRWAINPMTLQTGFVAWKGGQPVGKRMGSIFNPVITRDQLEDVGAPWTEAVAFDLVCISGEDVGVEAEYNANSYGGRKAFTDIRDALMKQSGIDADRIVPIVEMTSDEYTHKEFGLTYNPVFDIKDWGSMSQSAPAEEPGGDTAEEPKKEEPKVEAKAEEPVRRRRGAAGPVTDVPQETKAEEPVRRQRRRAAAS